MKALLILIFALFLAGCTKSDTNPQSSANPSDCCEIRFTPKGKICISEPALWLSECATELYRIQINEGRRLNGDAIFVPQVDPAEDIFRQCVSVKPLSADKASNYKKWLQDRVSEIQSITPAQTRREVNQILRQNGGIFTPSSIIYSHKDCDVLKVRIEFEPVSNGHIGFPLNENDKVKSASMPYLGFFICD